ncbi:helix-turn-helix transcriptional regulator [Aliiroseovarius sp. F20344]|uniref:helix-turn-helix transcriptional regulator n=1 Tax=Aliiroseovarius sp. F20344 TaxID=2926414 RepID=UPI001FF33014|nr:helix-turn-helix transcriptional regulator [Aliiroseovarius sp. F20344]MCK0143133.1 short-chain fatty acyl-CoA regulator family protein [Aliiroseovarius sp. F20344]
MPQSRLTGSRIRERRLVLGLKQASLAKSVGISAAYLNLIEHNRRRVGDALLDVIAQELKTDPSVLAEGAEAALLGALSEADKRIPDAQAELEKSEDFAGRFPGWASLVMAQNQRIHELEQMVEALSDRLTHDPELAASLHEVISAVTAIRSTAAILSGGGEVDQEWQDRFLRNMRDEGMRLSTAAQGLVEFLDAGASEDVVPIGPSEELATFLDQNDHYFPVLENPTAWETGVRDQAIGQVIAGDDALTSREAQDMARQFLERYIADAQAMPEEEFNAARNVLNWDPTALAQKFGQALPAVMRRIAFLPTTSQTVSAGVVSCDGAGALELRRTLPGFPLPRFGAACPYWPLFQALSQPERPVRAVVRHPGGARRRFVCQAICVQKDAPSFDRPAAFEAYMLIRELNDTLDDEALVHATPTEVGSSCRVCPRTDCAARREATILSAGSPL